MSSCNVAIITPGTATLSSGYTAKQTKKAILCDQARILASLQAGNYGCTKPPTSTRSAIYSSILTQDKGILCQASPQEIKSFPKAGTTESIRIQNLQQQTLLCSVDQYNPNTRYSVYRRFVPQAPCLGMTAEQLNSTMPKPSTKQDCNPGFNRYFR